VLVSFLLSDTCFLTYLSYLWYHTYERGILIAVRVLWELGVFPRALLAAGVPRGHRETVALPGNPDLSLNGARGLPPFNTINQSTTQNRPITPLPPRVHPII